MSIARSLKFLCCALACAALLSAKAAVTDGLVAFWPFDEITSSNTVQDVYYTNHFTLAGATPPTIVPGQVGNAVNLTGAGYLINSHDSNNVPSGLPEIRNGAYTIAMWIKGTNQTAKFIYTHGNTGNTTPLYILQTGQLATNNAKLDIIIRNDGGGAAPNHIVTTNVVFDNSWHHVAVVDNRGQVRIYIDGNQDIANFNYTPAGVLSFNNTVLGGLVRTTATPSFIGQVDELAVWERALTADEVSSVRTNGIPRPISQDVSILTQPANATKGLGDWALFSIAQSGVRPISYQWYRNGVLIPDATNRTFQATGLTLTNNGDYYQVAVSNSVSGLLSQRGTITVTNDPASDVRASLVNYWPLDVVTNKDGVFSSPELYSGNDMILRGFADTNTVEGRFAQALDFNDGAKFSYRTNGAPIYASTNYSLSMWVRAASAFQGNRRLFAEAATNSASPIFAIGIDSAATNGSLNITIRGDNNANAAVVGRKSTREGVTDVSTWHHIVWTDANGAGKLYIDGALDETDFSYTRAVTTLNTTALAAILQATPVNILFGQIDDVATWKRVLTYTEIQQIMTNGIPAPVAAIAPGFVTQPLTRTNGVFQGDTVSFNVQTSGTVPLVYQWYRNDNPISTNANPSAATDSLTLTNVQTSDSATTYFVRVTNSAGSAQSDTVGLNVAAYTPSTNGEVLKIDVGLTGSPNLQPGFSEFNLGMNGTNFNGVGVTILGINAPLADRLRAAVVNNPPLMTQAQIYNDFIFANSLTDGTGLRILIKRLAPNTKFGVTIWSHDSASTTLRQSDWRETSNPELPVDLQIAYTFDGAVLPTQDEQNTIKGTLVSTATGQLQIDGLRQGGNSFGAFVNAIRLVANPIPKILNAQLTNGGTTLRIDVEVAELGQAITIQERGDVATGNWNPASAALVDQAGLRNTYEVTINPLTAQSFFRVQGQ